MGCDWYNIQCLYVANVFVFQFKNFKFKDTLSEITELAKKYNFDWGIIPSILVDHRKWENYKEYVKDVDAEYYEAAEDTWVLPGEKSVVICSFGKIDTAPTLNYSCPGPYEINNEDTLIKAKFIKKPLHSFTESLTNLDFIGYGDVLLSSNYHEIFLCEYVDEKEIEFTEKYIDYLKQDDNFEEDIIF